MSSKKSVRDAAQWHGPHNLSLDHVRLVNDDLGWLRDVHGLTLWAVKHPPELLAKLPDLQVLRVEGGSGESLSFLEGCEKLIYLSLNQIRGLTDLSVVESLVRLKSLSIYGQPRVQSLPDLSRLRDLGRLELGSMKGLREGIGPALRAPFLEELQLIRAVALASGDAELIRDHPTLRTFEWLSADVPFHVVEPVLRTVGNRVHPRDRID